MREEFDRYLADRRALLLRHGARTLADELAGIGFTFEQVQRRGFASWPDHWVADGERLELGGRVLEAHLTPGHSRGHLMFLSDDLLFAGDHVLPHITPSLGFEAFTDGHALQAFLASLHASRDLPARLVLPGHGPVFEDLSGRVDELLAHHDTRLAACVAALAGGPLTAHEVAGRLTWTRRERPFADMDLVQPHAGDDRDDHAPRAARGPRRRWPASRMARSCATRRPRPCGRRRARRPRSGRCRTA